GACWTWSRIASAAYPSSIQPRSFRRGNSTARSSKARPPTWSSSPRILLSWAAPKPSCPSDRRRSADHVTLTRGFWIGKFEVTQGEYLSVMGTNPSFFPSDLSRPISSVSWPDATNYCWKLTQRELLAGRIPSGSQYRLPTEAEWECAARAGTSTRFSYGDDFAYTSLDNFAWYSVNAELTVHAVGQKLPNAWGLYDMEGNVWEWCQDWFGPLPGGVQTDPTGPASSPDGLKVMRGGAYDYPNSACRSASRLFFPASPFRSDSDLGFRVVLAGRQ